jgi:hypothetical protein
MPTLSGTLLLGEVRNIKGFTLLPDGTVLDRQGDGDGAKAWRKSKFAGDIRCPHGTRLVWVRGTDKRVTHFRRHYTNLTWPERLPAGDGGHGLPRAEPVVHEHFWNATTTFSW